MALETLNGVTEIGGFEVKRISWDQPNNNFIEINDKENAITFKIQNGPIKEVGVNGCDIQTMIETSLLILCGLNDKFPCEENSHAIACLKHAIFYLEERKINREERGVEGLNLP